MLDYTPELPLAAGIALGSEGGDIVVTTGEQSDA
jgi:hypothetical protein